MTEAGGEMHSVAGQEQAMSEKCPHCGAGVESYGDCGPVYHCGRIGKTNFGFHTKCLERQLEIINRQAKAKALERRTKP